MARYRDGKWRRQINMPDPGGLAAKKKNEKQGLIATAEAWLS